MLYMRWDIWDDQIQSIGDCIKLIQKEYSKVKRDQWSSYPVQTNTVRQWRQIAEKKNPESFKENRNQTYLGF